MPKEGKSAGVRQGPVWTDQVIIGGSDPLQTAGPMFIIEKSGTAATLSGLDAFVTGSLTAGRSFFNTVGSTAGSFFGGRLLAGNQVSGLDVFAAGSASAGRVLEGGRRIMALGAGSPTTYGQLQQAGSIATSAASVAWAVFGTAFSALPVYITAHSINTGGVDRAIGIASVTAGSFYAVSQGAASITFMWTATGAP